MKSNKTKPQKPTEEPVQYMEIQWNQKYLQLNKTHHGNFQKSCRGLPPQAAVISFSLSSNTPYVLPAFFFKISAFAL